YGMYPGAQGFNPALTGGIGAYPGSGYLPQQQIGGYPGAIGGYPGAIGGYPGIGGILPQQQGGSSSNAQASSSSNSGNNNIPYGK
uniref:Uncharacterized protein n=1 Tax=Panagrolaimus sp. ES5 TaxID=591445 RepID=A0AC34FVX0_9BILA